MEFKRLQDGKTYDITNYFIDGKEVTAEYYDSKLDYYKYSNSQVKRNPLTGNYTHSHSQN